METQGISVDSQVLIDASNTLKVNAFSPLQWNNSLLWISIILRTFGVYRAKVFLFFFLQMKIQKVEGEAHKVR